MADDKTMTYHRFVLRRGTTSRGDGCAEETLPIWRVDECA